MRDAATWRRMDFTHARHAAQTINLFGDLYGMRQFFPGMPFQLARNVCICGPL